MRKSIFLISLLLRCACLGQNQAPPASSQATTDAARPVLTTPAQPLHLEKAPASTRAQLESILPKVLIKESTLPEVARYFERESRKADPNHAGVRIVTLTPKDFGMSDATSAHVISCSEKEISLADALLIAAHLFNMKLEVRDNIYFMPLDVDFDRWEKQQPLSPAVSN